MLHKIFFYSLITFAVLCFSAESGLGDDFRSWQWLDVVTYQNETYTNAVHLESRWRNDSSDIHVGLGGIYNNFKVHPTTRLGLNFVYYEYFPDRGDSIGVFYPEPDLMNSFPLGKIATLSLRQRLEIRFIEGKDGVFPRSRHLAGVSFPLEELGPLKAFYMNEEFFYDWDSGEICQNRLVPAGLTFRVHEKIDFSLYYMLQSEKTASNWNQNHIIGSRIMISF